MLDRGQSEELSSALALGRFAENAIMALGRVLREEELRPMDTRALNDVRRLFERISSNEVIVVEPAEDQMLSDEGYLEALNVVELHEGTDLQDRARRYVELVEKALDETLTSDERLELATLRTLLVDVGETTLARASDLSRAYQEPSWPPAQLAISRF